MLLDENKLIDCGDTKELGKSEDTDGVLDNPGVSESMLDGEDGEDRDGDNVNPRDSESVLEGEDGG